MTQKWENVDLEKSLDPSKNLSRKINNAITKNIITKIYDRLESKEVIVRELINGFRIKGHLREGENG